MNTLRQKLRSTPKREKKSGESDLIEIVNKLQDKLAATGHSLHVSLPQIVVVGCQSAGKSSVLENIVGSEFLPRGSGVVTRRPTVVQLIPCEEEYGVFLHKPGEKYTDFQQIKAEILAETNRNPGPVGFSSVPISLKIFSPKVLKLTLVDLPGMIRVTVGNQSEESIQEVRNMVLDYISQPNSLILAVSPANQDIANSDALEIAKTVDPERIRTIGVLTKLDLMDEGTDAREVLENKKIPLKRGYVGVLNRSQKDIDEGRDIAYCLDKEEHFFASMPCYKHMAQRMGTPYLIKTLHQQLYVHIRESLPALRQELSEKLANLRKQLKEFKSEMGYSSGDVFSIQFYMIKLVQKFIERFQIEIFGYSEHVSTEELSAGAMINYKLYKNVQSTLKSLDVPNEETILIIVANLHGIRNSLSIPSLALETVINQLLTLYNEPLNNLVNNIVEILVSSVEKTSEMIDSYPVLKSEVLYLIRNYIDEASAETKEALEKHMQAEMYFMNTYHEDFTFPNLQNNAALFPLKLWNSCKMALGTSNPCNGTIEVESDQGEMESDQEGALEAIQSNQSAKANASMLAKTVENYLKILRKHIADIALKYILFFLVKKVMDFIKNSLVPTILESENTESILSDCEKDFSKALEIESTCKCLQEALSAVQNF